MNEWKMFTRKVKLKTAKLFDYKKRYTVRSACLVTISLYCKLMMRFIKLIHSNLLVAVAVMHNNLLEITNPCSRSLMEQQLIKVL